MKRSAFVTGVVLLLIALPAAAQQQPSILEMRAAIAASMAQTNAIRDLHIQAEVRAATLADENAKLKMRLDEAEKKLGEKP